MNTNNAGVFLEDIQTKKVQLFAINCLITNIQTFQMKIEKNLKRFTYNLNAQLHLLTNLMKNNEYCRAA